VGLGDHEPDVGSDLVLGGDESPHNPRRQAIGPASARRYPRTLSRSRPPDFARRAALRHRTRYETLHAAVRCSRPRREPRPARGAGRPVAIARKPPSECPTSTARPLTSSMAATIVSTALSMVNRSLRLEPWPRQVRRRYGRRRAQRPAATVVPGWNTDPRPANSTRSSTDGARPGGPGNRNGDRDLESTLRAGAGV